MITIDCPCCGADLSVDSSLPEVLACEVCQVSVVVGEPEVALGVEIAA